MCSIKKYQKKNSFRSAKDTPISATLWGNRSRNTGKVQLTPGQLQTYKREAQVRKAIEVGSSPETVFVWWKRGGGEEEEEEGKEKVPKSRLRLWRNLPRFPTRPDTTDGTVPLGLASTTGSSPETLDGGTINRFALDSPPDTSAANRKRSKLCNASSDSPDPGSFDSEQRYPRNPE